MSKPTSQILSWHLDPPRGAHPKSVTRARVHCPPSPSTPSSCTLQLTHVLPPILFADAYELELYRGQYTFNISDAHADLEKPVFAVPQDEVVLSVNIDVCKGEERERQVEVEVEVPLHVRYGMPRDGGEEDTTTMVLVRPPEASLLCTSQEPHRLDVVPGVQSQKLRVPVGDLRHLRFVEIGTVVAVFVAFAWVAWCAISMAGKMHATSARKGIKEE